MPSTIHITEAVTGSTERAKRQGFGATLGVLRTAAGLTQEELGDRSGLSARTIRNLETGYTERPRRRSAESLATALGLPEDETRRLLVAAGWCERHPAPGATRPASAEPRSEVPVATSLLVGREHTVSELCGHLLGQSGSGGERLAAVTGPTGSGKTSTVARVAHVLRERFRDGQIYVDLDGDARQPMSGEAVTARVLRSLHVEPDFDSAEERAAGLRALLADRRVLIVLDNARSEAQIRPLLCGRGSSAVLVAGPRQLCALPEGRTTQLELLSTEDSLFMLERLIGTDRFRAEPSAAQSIAMSCGHLPLALHIAALWMAARPHRRLRDLADRLVDENERLNCLQVGDLSVRAKIAAGFARLSADDQESLRKLSSLRGFFGVEDAAKLLGESLRTATDRVEDLLHQQMLWYSRSRKDHRVRARLHDFVRLYASRPADHPRVLSALPAHESGVS